VLDGADDGVVVVHSFRSLAPCFIILSRAAAKSFTNKGQSCEAKLFSTFHKLFCRATSRDRIGKIPYRCSSKLRDVARQNFHCSCKYSLRSLRQISVKIVSHDVSRCTTRHSKNRIDPNFCVSCRMSDPSDCVNRP
jgi:hypothetical protein